MNHRKVADPEVSPPRRVAVIGVHGVAHHDPGETANAMADLLVSLPSFNPRKACTTCTEELPPRKFDYFDSQGIQIPLRPVCIDEGSRVSPSRSPSPWSLFRLEEGSLKFAQHLWVKRGIGRSLGENGRQWSVKLLQDYYGAGDSNKYVTTRLSGQRVEDRTKVHIYEMFWADLARPDNSVLSFFLALFQFILGLPGLSRLAIVRPNASRTWRLFQSLHRYASRVLQMVLPLGAVILLVVLATAIPAVRTIPHLNFLSASIAAGMISILGFVLVDYNVKPVLGSRISWLAVSFLPAILVFSFATIFMRHQASSLPAVTLAGVVWMLGAGLFWWALNAYQATRPGMEGWGWAFYVATLVTFVLFAHYAREINSDVSFWIQEASFWTVQWLLFLLRISWIALALLAILSSLVGGIAWRLEKTKTEKSKARAAVRTSRLALALPSFLFIVVTSVIWAALFTLGHKVHDPFYNYEVLHDSCPHWLATANKYVDLFPSLTAIVQPDYLKGVLSWSVGSASALVLFINIAGLIVLVWWALPSVLTETSPPRRRYDWYIDHHTEPPRSSTNHDSMWMGTWISRGLDLTALVTWLSWIAMFLLSLAFMYAGKLPWPLQGLRAYLTSFTNVLIAFLLPAAIVVLIRLQSLNSVLRIIRDVTTYLSSGPIEATPRAKIFERYVSLLRHVAKYKDPDGKGYDHIVIVAHSLGALISGDLLNLLHHQKNDQALENLGFGPIQTGAQIPICLFTMGNPLRQLLNRFFPYLYDWVRHDPDNGSKPLPAPRKEPPTEFDSLLPDPNDVGAEKWVSAYRSGDYVGRSLWLDEWYKRSAGCNENGIYPEALFKLDAGTRVEFCIGAGAHTHYWDDTAPDIAEELNSLI